MTNKLVIIDGNSLFYRSFYALPLLSNSNGEYSNAVYGFAVQIARIIQEIKPTHIAVAFDAGKHTFRNDMYDQYKSNRKPMPPELKSQIEPLKKMLSLMNIKYCEKAGFEGDDIVGSLSKKFANTQTIIVTADRDTLQLIDDTTNVYFTKKGTTELYIVDKNVLKKDYGLAPNQIIDLKALQGDMSDNIPGVAGIGEKTAIKLLQDYSTIENLYAHIDEFSGKLGENLKNGKESAFLSKELATIKTDVDIDCNIDDCKYVFPFDEKLKEFFKLYDFKSLLKRPELFVGVNKEGVSVQKNVRIEDVKDTKNLEKLQKLIKSQTKIAFFCDKNNINLCYNNTEFAFFVNDLNKNALMQLFSEIFAANKEVILFDSKLTRHYLDEFDVKIECSIFDVSIAKHLVDGTIVKAVDSILLDEQDRKVPAKILFDLQKELSEKLEAMGMMKLYRDIELPLSEVLYEMENDGFKIDIEVLNKLSNKFSEELADLEKQIFELAGVEFNVNSPKQLAEVLYEKLGLKHGRKQSTSADNLEKITDLHPVVPLVLRYRKIAKLNNTYIEGFRPRIDNNGLVHTTFNQTLTNTGRLSSADPNLQNIPIRSDDGKVVRSMFVARQKDYVLTDADYSQIELRILAHMTGDEYFIEAFNNNEDIHTKTASLVFGVPMSEVDKLQRRVAKVVNFGIIYGISEYGLASDLHISAWQAKDLINNFYSKHPKVKEFMQMQVDIAKQTGRVSTLFGRSRSMTDINSSNYMVRSMAERASQNMPLQGTAADIVKIAMIKVRDALRKNNLKTKLILQVHDELVLDGPASEAEMVAKIVKDSMENATKLCVPLTVDVAQSYRWSDGH